MRFIAEIMRFLIKMAKKKMKRYLVGFNFLARVQTPSQFSQFYFSVDKSKTKKFKN